MPLRVVYWMRGSSHDDVLKLSIASVNKAYGGEADVYVMRDTDPTQPAMLANLRCQLNFLATARQNDTVLFLDADVLLLEEIPWEFKDGDVVVTWRDRVKSDSDEEGIASIMPYNFGVIGARACPQAVEAWTWMYARVAQMNARYQNWYGNQLALAELCGARPNEGRMYSRVPIAWTPYLGSYATKLEVLKVPCEQFNYTPESADEDVSMRFALHFKGNRKEMMAQYAKRLGIDP